MSLSNQDIRIFSPGYPELDSINLPRVDNLEFFIGKKVRVASDLYTMNLQRQIVGIVGEFAVIDTAKLAQKHLEYINKAFKSLKVPQVRASDYRKEHIPFIKDSFDIHFEVAEVGLFKSKLNFFAYIGNIFDKLSFASDIFSEVERELLTELYRDGKKSQNFLTKIAINSLLLANHCGQLAARVCDEYLPANRNKLTEDENRYIKEDAVLMAQYSFVLAKDVLTKMLAVNPELAGMFEICLGNARKIADISNRSPLGMELRANAVGLRLFDEQES